MPEIIWLPVTVNRSLSFDQMIEAGNYKCVLGDGMRANHPDRFSDTSISEIQMGWIETDVNMSREEIQSIALSNNTRLADVVELLAFGATYQIENLTIPIIALGSSCDSGSFLSDVGSIGSSDHDEHLLYLGYCELVLLPAKYAIVKE